VGAEHAEGIEQEEEPGGEGVGTAVEARDAERAGEIAHAPHDAQGALLMVLEAGGGGHGDRHHLGVTDPRERMGAMAEGVHQVVSDDKGGYNQRIVHASSTVRRCLQATPFSDARRMNAN
jgi:hypothetical protein